MCHSVNCFHHHQVCVCLLGFLLSHFAYFALCVCLTVPILMSGVAQLFKSISHFLSQFTLFVRISSDGSTARIVLLLLKLVSIILTKHTSQAVTVSVSMHVVCTDNNSPHSMFQTPCGHVLFYIRSQLILCSTQPVLDALLVILHVSKS